MKNIRTKPPRLTVNDETIQKIKHLSKIGFTQEQMAAYFGFSPSGWYTLRRKNAELDKAAIKGQMDGVEFVAGALWAGIERGEMAAIIFFLKTKGKFFNLQYKVEGDQPIVKMPAIKKITISDPIEAAKLYQQIMQEK